VTTLGFAVAMRAGSMLAIGVPDPNFEVHQLTVAIYGEMNPRGRCPIGNYRGEVARPRERCTVDGSDYVAGFDSSLSGGTTRFGPVKDCTVGFHHTKAFGEWAGHRSYPDANPSAVDGHLPHVLGGRTT